MSNQKLIIKFSSAIALVCILFLPIVGCNGLDFSGFDIFKNEAIWIELKICILIAIACGILILCFKEYLHFAISAISGIVTLIIAYLFAYSKNEGFNLKIGAFIGIIGYSISAILSFLKLIDNKVESKVENRELETNKFPEIQISKIQKNIIIASVVALFLIVVGTNQYKEYKSNESTRMRTENYEKEREESIQKEKARLAVIISETSVFISEKDYERALASIDNINWSLNPESHLEYVNQYNAQRENLRSSVLQLIKQQELDVRTKELNKLLLENSTEKNEDLVSLPYTTLVITDKTYFYQDPNTNSDRLFPVTKNNTLTVMAIQSEFVFCKFNFNSDSSASGWVLKKDLAQDSDEILDTVYDFRNLDQISDYPGGELEMIKFIQKNIRYPEMARKMGIRGAVYVKFIVTKTGTIKRASVTRGIGSNCDEEALRLVYSMPFWIPGKRKTKVVNSWNIIAVEFVL